MSREIVEVYADWQPIEAPLLIGQLTYSDSSRGGVFSFAYDKAFLTSAYRLQIDPILTLHTGELYNDEAEKNFRAFLDSSPDRWGRILMQRRAAIEARKGIRATSRFEVLMAVKQWQTVAKRLGISRAEQAMKQSAFNV